MKTIAPHDRWQALQAHLQRPADPRGRAIGPGAFNQHATYCRISSLGDAAPPHPLAGRALARHQTEIGHQLARALEAAYIADLGHKGHRGQKRHPTQGLISLDHRRHRPGLDHLSDLLVQALQSRLGILDRLPVLAQDEILGRMLEDEFG